MYATTPYEATPRRCRQPWPPPDPIMQLVRAARSRWLDMQPQERPAHLLDLLNGDEAAQFSRAGYSMRGRVRRYILAPADSDVLPDDDLARLLRTLQRRPDVTTALRKLLLGGAA